MGISIDLKSLKETLTSGRRMMPNAKSTLFGVMGQKDIVYLLFLSPTVQYVTRFKGSGDIPLSYCDVETFQNVLKSKEGDVSIELVKGGTSLSLKTKGFNATLPLSPEPENSPSSDVVKSLFTSKAKKEGAIDATTLTRMPKDTFKVFKSIRDNISSEDLSVTATWGGKSLQVLLADHFHGALITVDLPDVVSKAQLTLPVQAFLKVIEIGSSVSFDDKRVQAVSKKEYLSCAIKQTKNQTITVDMMMGLLSTKKVNRMLLDRGSATAAFESCRSVSVDISPIKLDVAKNTVTLSVASPSGSVAEKIKAGEFKGKETSLTINISNLKDILSCMGDTFELAMTNGDPILFETGGEGLRIQGACIAFSE